MVCVSVLVVFLSVCLSGLVRLVCFLVGFVFVLSVCSILECFLSGLVRFSVFWLGLCWF